MLAEHNSCVKVGLRDYGYRLGCDDLAGLEEELRVVYCYNNLILNCCQLSAVVSMLPNVTSSRRSAQRMTDMTSVNLK